MLKLITDITDDWTSGLGGLKVGKYIDTTFSQTPQMPIELSFYGIDMITPSFVNGAFLYVIDLYGDEFFTQFIKIKQIKPQVAHLIRSSIEGYKTHRHTFLQQLKTNNIYCAIDGSQKSIDFRYRLFQATQNKGFNFYFNPDDTLFSKDAQENINKADVCIGIVTKQEITDNIIAQINYALTQNKPCILLCNKNVELNIATKVRDKIKMIYYSQSNYFEAIKQINQLVLDGKKIYHSPIKKTTKEAKDTQIAVGLLGAALLLFLLGTVLNED